ATLPGDRHDDRLIAANRPGNSTRPVAGVENACRAQARELRSGRVDTAVGEPAGHIDDDIDAPGGVIDADLPEIAQLDHDAIGHGLATDEVEVRRHRPRRVGGIERQVAARCGWIGDRHVEHDGADTAARHTGSAAAALRTPGHLKVERLGTHQGAGVAARTVARVHDARRHQRIEQPGAWSRVRRTLPRDPALNVEDDVDGTLRIEERDGAVITDRHLNQVWHGLTCDDIEVRGDWRAWNLD